MADQNFLYYGDNLDILPRYVKDESVDLIYLDPPFNSNANYNVLFPEHGNGTKSVAQLQAFKDTWTWAEAAPIYYATVEAGGKLSEVLQAFRQLVGEGGMLAYLSMMAPRLAQLHRVLKPTGSIYLHCDPTASQYLKLLMDAIFGPRNFRNEITWKRSSAHSDTKQGMRRCGKIRDILLFYTKTGEYTWNPQYTLYTKEYLKSEYRHCTPDGRYYKETDLTGAKPGGDTSFEWRVKRQKGHKGTRWQADLENEYENPVEGIEYKGVRPYDGRYWAYSHDNIVAFYKAGSLIHRETGMPRLVQHADEMPGVPLQDLWDDIQPVSGKEDLGYPTQKPRLLLERVIRGSSNKGDVILDPFCGCGTAVAVAETLGRRWIGIDITYAAIAVIKKRLLDTSGADATFKVIGEPVSIPDAQRLAADDPYQFQWWALGLLGARPVEQKKGADHGIDGRLYFHDELTGPTKQIIFSVKAGHTGVSHVSELAHVVAREKAQIGVLISMQRPTGPMRAEAAGAGFYTSPWGKHPRVQILTVAEILDGRGIDYPKGAKDITFKDAPKPKAQAQTIPMDLD